MVSQTLQQLLKCGLTRALWIEFREWLCLLNPKSASSFLFPNWFQLALKVFSSVFYECLIHKITVVFSYHCTVIERKSCAELLRDGWNSSGVYTINPDGGNSIQVLCDMTTEGGGWTVFQRRLDGSVDFYRGWESYKNGFGNLSGEFWLGNDNIHRLTDSDDVILRVDLEDFEGNITYAEYTTFKVADEADKYRLLIRGYDGTAGDSMAEGYSVR